MRILTVVALSLASSISAAGAERFSSVEAINRCDAFVDFAMREDLPDSSKHPFKVLCYFSFMDPRIHDAPREVCAQTARSYSSPTRDLAEFICNGAYGAYLAENAEPN